MGNPIAEAKERWKNKTVSLEYWMVSNASAGESGKVSVLRQLRESNFDSNKSLQRVEAEPEETCLEGDVQQDRLKPALG